MLLCDVGNTTYHFLDDEKEFRKELYPPYKKLCRILFAHKNANIANLIVGDDLGDGAAKAVAAAKGV